MPVYYSDYRRHHKGEGLMKTNRRGFIAGTTAALFTAPAIVRAASLDYVPRHRYYVFVYPENALLDFVRDDGRLVGWLQPWEIRVDAPRSPQQLLSLAMEGVSEQTRQTAEEMFYAEEIYCNPSLSLAAAHTAFTKP